MLRNYFITAIRNLYKNKIYAIINILGLSVGITCFLLISLYVYNELSYDRFFKDSNRLYRIALERQYPDHTRYFASTPVTIVPVLLEHYPDVEEATMFHRLFFLPFITVNIDEESYAEERFQFADSSFFSVFSFNFLEGNPETALNSQDKAVITKSTARRYFGDQEALGKIILIDTIEIMISGVIDDVPKNSHMEFDLLGSIHSLPFIQASIEQNSWVNPWVYTYIKLRNGAQPDQFESKLEEMVDNYGLTNICSSLGISEEEYSSSGHNFRYILQQVPDIHLHSNLTLEVSPNSNISYIYLLIAVAILILLITCINFVNLATARSTERAREVGIRKVMGSGYFLLIRQFLLESVFISMISLFVAILMVWLLLPSFNTLVSKSLEIGTVSSPIVFAGLILLGLIIGILAGIYPAFVISSVETSTVLKGSYKTGNKGKWVRNGLLIFQFFISVVMITGTLMIIKQMKYIRNKDLGFIKENILVIRQAQALGQNYEAFKNEVKNLPGVLDAGSGFGVPGDFLGSNIFTPDHPETPQLRANTLTIDKDYLRAMKMEIIDGRDFSRDFNDSLSIIINQAAATTLAFENPLNHKLSASFAPARPEDPQYEIVGIVEDFNFNSLHSKVTPLIMFNGNSFFVPVAIVLRVQSDNLPQTIQAISNKWNDIVDNQELSYTFLDDDLDALYQSDLMTGRIFNTFTIIAIIMACIGLFGLTAYITQQRVKEIGIRKVLGATVSDIILLLSWDFTKLIFISFLIAIPVAYLGIDKWLETYAYRTGISGTVFLLSGVFTILVSWLTISYLAIKMAIINPARSIQYE
ncbi:ABC transporter permease [Bacteroidota bacterium]